MQYRLIVLWYYIEIGWAKLTNRIFKKDASIIPGGVYCYTFNGTSGHTPEGLPWMGTDVCPYYRSMRGSRAGCTYVGFIGWDCCLGDQCKICGENENFSENDLED